MSQNNQYNTIEEALRDLREGKVILVTDDPDRENEGDLICAAEFATQENINFMATYAKGLICTPMSAEIAAKLNFPPMVAENTDNHGTAFTVAVDHADTTTGISAAERSYTIRKCVDEEAKPEDFRRPGHVFPLIARKGGVLVRNGHTEATTPAQMKMFLTRIGFGSKVIITGDKTQKDLPSSAASGLDVAMKVLKKVDGISFCELTSKDVVRHPLVQKIVQAYEEYEKKAVQKKTDRTVKSKTKTSTGTTRRKS